MSTPRSTADRIDTYTLPAGGRARLSSWALTPTRMQLSEDLLAAAAAPCLYSLYAMAHSEGAARRHPIGYTGVTTNRYALRMEGSLAKFSEQPGFELRGISLLTITSPRTDLREAWLRTLEAEVVADQVLRRHQVQSQSRAPSAVAALRDTGVSDRVMGTAVRKLLAGIRAHEDTIGIGTAPWGARGSASLRDLLAVSALRLADADGTVGHLSWFLEQVAVLPAVSDRNIQNLADSVGRDIRNREPDLVLARMQLDSDRILRVTDRAMAALG